MRPQLVRALALHFLAGETDQFVRVLRLGAKSLQEDPARLKLEMQEHLLFVQASPAVETKTRIADLFGQALAKVDVGKVRANLQRPKRGNMTHGHGRFKKHTYLPEKKFDFSVSDLEMTRINSKKLRNWIVSEEQAES